MCLRSVWIKGVYNRCVSVGRLLLLLCKFLISGTPLTEILQVLLFQTLRCVFITLSMMVNAGSTAWTIKCKREHEFVLISVL